MHIPLLLFFLLLLSTAPVKAEEPDFSITAVIDVSVTLKSQVKPEQTIFVFAKAVDGPRAPLAVYKGSAKDLPLRVTLTDSMAMSPQFALSAFKDKKIRVSARVSQSGMAGKERGDFEGMSDEFILKKKNPPLTIFIGSVVQ
ncbi:MAG: hypothetical protein HQK84_01390 [Nitrospinae bacterium]|nr:hypothetical protein [Nitrospinota bacterium]